MKRRRNERCVGWSYRVTLRTGEVFFDVLSGRGNGDLRFRTRGTVRLCAIRSMRASGIWIGYGPDSRRGRYRPGAEMACAAMAEWHSQFAKVFNEHKSEYDAIFGSK